MNIKLILNTKDLKDDFTQFYNLSYEYETDCLLFHLNIKRNFLEMVI